MSKGLEALKEIKEKYKDDNGLQRRLIITEKELKALEIIKKKGVNVCWLFACFAEGGLEKYNNYLDMLYLPECNLTQEQFDFLKDVLE